MTEFRISVKSAKSAAALRKMLQNRTDLEIEEIENERIIKGLGDAQTFASLCGSWVATAPRLSAEQIRRTAWERKITLSVLQ
jgi:hypothetical protein